MQNRLYDRPTDSVRESATNVKEIDMSTCQRLLMVVLNAIPILHATLLIACAAVSTMTAWQRVVVGLAILYLLPPCLCRLVMVFSPIHRTHIAVGTREFFTWWSLLNLQVVFCRFSFLEELLRMVPGLYSAWLRLWGSRIGRLTYWAAGTAILERQYLDIGDDVMLGAGARLNAHVLVRNNTGQLELLLAPIKIGAGAMVGGYSLLTTGTEIAPGEMTRAMTMSPPFTRWENGRREKIENDWR